MNILEQIPEDLFRFVIVVLFSLLIGLEQRVLHENQAHTKLFGTDRTFALIGIFGFVLYKLNTETLVPFLVGLILISALLSVYYFAKVKDLKYFGLTSIIAVLLTYCISPLVFTQPHWLSLLIIVSVLILLEIKEELFEFSKKIGNDEFITFSKFVIIAGIILPLLSDKPISELINISPYNFWLAIVVVSSISYVSYLLQKFVFPKSGLLLTGILGGLYSSTATTIVLARKSKSESFKNGIVSSILIATSMMYIRLIILAYIFNKSLALVLLIYLIPLALFSALLSIFYQFKNKATRSTMKIEKYKNPLEFKTALTFGILFVFFAIITQLITLNYGSGGLKILALIVGVTDIDPFILNLFQTHTISLSEHLIVMATIIATVSNAVLKMIYAISIGDKMIKKNIVIGFSLIIFFSIILIEFI